MAKRDLRKVPLRSGESSHPHWPTVYWAEVDIVDKASPKQILHTVKVDSSISEHDAAHKAVVAAGQWIAANEEENVAK